MIKGFRHRHGVKRWRSKPEAVGSLHLVARPASLSPPSCTVASLPKLVSAHNDFFSGTLPALTSASLMVSVVSQRVTSAHCTRPFVTSLDTSTRKRWSRWRVSSGVSIGATSGTATEIYGSAINARWKRDRDLTSPCLTCRQRSTSRGLHTPSLAMRRRRASLVELGATCSKLRTDLTV